MEPIDFRTEPARYRHWKIEVDGEVASLIMDVDPAGGLSGDYELKQSEFGVEPYSTGFGAVGVQDVITVRFHIVALDPEHR